MKKILWLISTILVNILLIASSITTAVGICYYALPNIDAAVTPIISWFVKTFTESGMFWLTIASAVTYVVSLVLSKFTNKKLPVKTKNLIIHISSWLFAIVAIVCSVSMFILTDNITTAEVQISYALKINCGVLLAVYVLYNVFKGRIRAFVHRKLQSHENAVELQIQGRSNIFFTNVLKVFEWFFPELVLLILFCLFVSWNLSGYVIVALGGLIFPFLGNIECDINSRNDAIKRKKQQDDKLAEKVAEKLSKR